VYSRLSHCPTHLFAVSPTRTPVPLSTIHTPVAPGTMKMSHAPPPPCLFKCFSAQCKCVSARFKCLSARCLYKCVSARCLYKCVSARCLYKCVGARCFYVSCFYVSCFYVSYFYVSYCAMLLTHHSNNSQTRLQRRPKLARATRRGRLPSN